MEMYIAITNKDKNQIIMIPIADRKYFESSPCVYNME